MALRRQQTHYNAGPALHRYKQRNVNEVSGIYVSESQDYPLGYSEEEAQRLAQRAALLEPLTGDVFQRAGLGAGMRVLDIGCGIGDVSLLAAAMVGAQGCVLGIDRSPSSVEAARRRTAARGVTHVEFQVADLGDIRDGSDV